MSSGYVLWEFWWGVGKKRNELLPQKHWETNKEIYCIKQAANFVHGTPVYEFVIGKLHVIKKQD